MDKLCAKKLTALISFDLDELTLDLENEVNNLQSKIDEIDRKSKIIQPGQVIVPVKPVVHRNEQIISDDEFIFIVQVVCGTQTQVLRVKKIDGGVDVHIDSHLIREISNHELKPDVLLRVTETNMLSIKRSGGKYDIELIDLV